MGSSEILSSIITQWSRKMFNIGGGGAGDICIHNYVCTCLFCCCFLLHV